MDLKRIPEFDMSIDELSIHAEKLAERKIGLVKEMIQLDAELAMCGAILTTKAMKELKVIL